MYQMKFFIVTFIFCASVAANAQSTNWNRIELSGGIEINLPQYPSNPQDLATFLTLTPEEQNSFYLKRKLIIEKVAGGIAKPGIGSTMRWTKNKIFSTVSYVRSRLGYIRGKFSKAQVAVGEVDISDEKEMATEELIEFSKIPDNMSDETKAFVESTITALTQNLWSNSHKVAKSSGIGMTFVFGPIWNTTFGRLGFVAGRGLSADLGYNFDKDEGYLIFRNDKQTLSKGGFSFDIGLMFDAMLHVMDSETEETMQFSHMKLPFIGCFRNGPNYTAWGFQVGLHVVEMAGIIGAFFGHPELAASVPLMRLLGMGMVYKTDLKRQTLKSLKLPADHPLLKAIGLGQVSNATSFLRVPDGLTCPFLF